ncbi:MAG: hypothetical protein GX493_04630 [Firmicutes bacterium]|nr:hypothetical protein [Bacillota bacterium]
MYRYARQISLSGWGLETQSRLRNASVFLAGLGGLGSVVALYLAGAGVGRIAAWTVSRPSSCLTNIASPQAFRAGDDGTLGASGQSDLDAMADHERAAWIALLDHCLESSSGQPSPK